jgi:glycerophosphoryl diester phosphodiesterase
MANPRVQVTGHRGAAAVEPENTLRGFKYALSLGVERAETDVHLSKDQQIIVMHDATVDRTTNGTGKIAEMTLAELKKLDAGHGERVPALQEVIDLFQVAWQGGNATLLQIELKGEGTALPVVNTIKHNAIESRVVLTSFHAERVAEAHRLLPGAIFGLLTSSLDPDPVQIALRVGAESVHLRHDLATRQWVERVHKSGLHARVWNIDEAERMKWAIALGVDGIGTNDPALLLEVLAGNR